MAPAETQADLVKKAQEADGTDDDKLFGVLDSHKSWHRP